MNFLQNPSRGVNAWWIRALVYAIVRLKLRKVKIPRSRFAVRSTRFLFTHFAMQCTARSRRLGLACRTSDVELVFAASLFEHILCFPNSRVHWKSGEITLENGGSTSGYGQSWLRNPGFRNPNHRICFFHILQPGRTPMHSKLKGC